MILPLNMIAQGGEGRHAIYPMKNKGGKLGGQPIGQATATK
jgi:hypothetical protein